MCNPDLNKKSSNTTTASATTTHGPSSSSTTISPVIPSGFHRRKVPIATSMLVLVLFYTSLSYFLKDSTTWLRPADEFCTEGDDNDESKCSRSDLFAFQAASAVMQLFMAGMGLYAWHIGKRCNKGLPQTPEGRLFGYLPEADTLLVGIFVYQTFDFFASMSIPEHNTVVFLGHHALASFTAWMSLEYQMVHYYAVFFGGCSVRKLRTLVVVMSQQCPSLANGTSGTHPLVFFNKKIACLFF